MKIKKLNYLTVVIGLTIIGAIIYSNSFDVPFQLDDDIQIIDDGSGAYLDKYRDVSQWLSFYKYRPLSKLSLAMNYQIHQDHVFGYHLVNLIIHITASFIVFLFLMEILKSPVFRGRKYNMDPSVLAMFGAIVFLAHPIQTQSVTYIVQRMTSMAGLFYLLSCFLYLKSRYNYTLNKK